MVESVARVKGANPAARYCCDPVIGDVSQGVFVRRGIPEFIKERMLPIADVVTPNQFELDYLVGRPSVSTADLVAAIDAIHVCGPRVVLVTSVHTEDTPEECLDLIVSDGIDRCRLRTPLLPVVVNGAGDAIATSAPARWLKRWRWPVRRFSVSSIVRPKRAPARCC